MCGAGEQILEPEVDLSAFLERQRLAEDAPLPTPTRISEDEDDVDHALSHISSIHTGTHASMKGRTQELEWTPDLDEMSKDKAAAEANWGIACSIPNAVMSLTWM